MITVYSYIYIQDKESRTMNHEAPEILIIIHTMHQSLQKALTSGERMLPPGAEHR